MQFSSAQNLVPNPSFEDTIICPDAGGQVSRAEFWNIVSNTPDYFHSCSIYPQFGVPSNIFGYQYANSGNAYMGLWDYFSWSVYPEQIGAFLISPMIIGQKYFVSMKVCLAWNPDYGNNTATDKLGILFSVNDYLNTPPPINNFAHIYTDSIILDSVNWTTVNGTIIADSAYGFISIGNFFDAANTDTTHLNNSNVYQSYYYIDDVCVSIDSLTCQGLENGIKAILDFEKLEVFPNPTRKRINFKNIPEDCYRIELYNSEGRLLSVFIEEFSEDYSIDITSYLDRLLTLNFLCKNNIISKKIILIN